MINKKLTFIKHVLFSLGIFLIAFVSNAQTDTSRIIETVPVYPGCSGSTTEQKACFNKKIGEHISNNFDFDMVQKLGFPPGKMKIYVRFTIGSTGNTEDILVLRNIKEEEATHPKLEEEVIRVFKMIPKMEPGTQRNRPVRVKYTFPLAFMVD